MKKILLILALGVMLPSISHADEDGIVYYDDTDLDTLIYGEDYKRDESKVEEPIKQERTDTTEKRELNYKEIDKKVLEAKGFTYLPEYASFNGHEVGKGGAIVDYYFDDGENYREISESDFKEVDKWAIDVYEKSGAVEKTSEKEKVRNIAAYLMSNYKYNMEDGNDYWYDSLYRYGKAKCTGFSLGLVRILENIGIKSYFAKADCGGSHAVVRAKLDGVWTTVETTATSNAYNFFEDLAQGEDIDEDIFPTNISYVNSKEDFSKYNTEYKVIINKEVENYLDNHSFEVY